nr:NucA/NucB deoxyribonuclease domain-containing protein [Streptomyces incarnatus]
MTGSASCAPGRPLRRPVRRQAPALGDQHQAEEQEPEAVCGGCTAPPDMKRAGRTYCDEYPFASTYEGGTRLPASQRETTWVSPNENNTQGARITNWRQPMHVMDNDPFYVVA